MATLYRPTADSMLNAIMKAMPSKTIAALALAYMLGSVLRSIEDPNQACNIKIAAQRTLKHTLDGKI